MATRYFKFRKERIGIAPETLLYESELKTGKVEIQVLDFNSENLEELELDSIQDSNDYNQPGSTSWINIYGLGDSGVLEELSEMYHINKMVMAEVLNAQARPRIIEFEDCLFIGIKMLSYSEESGKTTAENLAIIFNKNILFTFQETTGDVFNPIRERIRKNRRRIRESGTDYLAFTLLDVIIDHYMYILSRVGEKIEELDEELIGEPSPDSLERINLLKGEIIFFRRTFKPVRELVLNFIKNDSDFVDEELEVFLNQLKSNIDMANEATDNYREILSDQLNIFHTNISYKLNGILKFLTIFSVIFIPITFVAGVYGTNFDYMPELQYQYSYFIMWGICIAIVVGMITYFKIKKWF